MLLCREQGLKFHLPVAGLRGPHQVQHGPTVWLGGDLPGRTGGLQLGWIFGKFASCCQVCMVGFGRKAKPGLATGDANVAACSPPSPRAEVRVGGVGFQVSPACKDKDADSIGFTC